MITLRQSDLDELRNSYNYLSDVIMEFYFNYLSSIFPSDSILFVSPTVSFMIANSEDDKDVRDCLKPLEISSKGLIIFPVNNGGTHWSLLVYHRGLNVFAHHDSLDGLNNFHAQALYLAVKKYMLWRNGFRYWFFNSKRKNMDGPNEDPKLCVPKTPQQGNGFDCGLYVMAIAKAICQWYCSEEEDKPLHWLDDVDENVNSSLEKTMRFQVLELIQEASLGRLGSVSCTIEERRSSESSDLDILGIASDDDFSGMEEGDDAVAHKFIGPLTEEEAEAAETDWGTVWTKPLAVMEEETVKAPRFCGIPRGPLSLKGKEDVELELFVASRCGTSPASSIIVDCGKLKSSSSDCGTSTLSTVMEEDLAANNRGMQEASTSCSTMEEDKDANDVETTLVGQLAEEAANACTTVEHGYNGICGESSPTKDHCCTEREGTNHTRDTSSSEENVSSDGGVSAETSVIGDQETHNGYLKFEPIEEKPLTGYGTALSSSFNILEEESSQ